MALNDDLAEWAGSRPDRQQDAIGRFCRNEVLTDGEVVSTVTQDRAISDSPAALVGILRLLDGSVDLIRGDFLSGSMTPRATAREVYREIDPVTRGDEGGMVQIS